MGKSTVSLNLARALADSGRGVGLLDADVYGPDIPLMLGIKRTRELRSWLLGRSAADLQQQLFSRSRLTDMSGLRCPHCGERIDVFPPVAGERSVLREVPPLGEIPLDPAYARLNGVPPAFTAIAERVEHALA